MGRRDRRAKRDTRDECDNGRDRGTDHDVRGPDDQIKHPSWQQSSWVGRRLRPLMERHGWAYTRLRVEHGKPDRGYVRTPSPERLREGVAAMSTRGVEASEVPARSRTIQN
jgi:hypothetical protein